MRPLALALLAAAVLTACGNRPEPVGSTLSPYPVTVRGAGSEPLVVEHRPRSVAALASGAAEIVLALGAEERLVAAPAGVESTASDVVRPSGLVDLESLVRAAPELIVAAPESDPELVAAAERRTLAHVYVAPDESVPDTVRAILELGLVLGEPVRARELAREVRRDAAAVAERTRGAAPVRTFVDAGFLATVPERSLPADLVRRAGGTPVGTQGRGAFDPCRIVRLRAEVVLRLVDEDLPGRRPPRFGGCGPGAPRVVDVDSELVTRAGPRVGYALRIVAQALHGDAR